MSRKRSIVIATLITFVITSLMIFGVVRLYDSGLLSFMGIATPDSGISAIKRAEQIIDSKFYGEVDKNKLYEGALKGMLESLGDEYTWYVDEESYKDLSLNLTGEYTGIGVNVSIDSADNLITIISPIEDTPAFKAGLKAGDKIISIDSVAVSLENYQQAINMMRGSDKQAGQEVVLSVKRAETGKIEEIRLKREHIILKTVKSKLLPQNIGYIRITSFDENTDNEFARALNEMNVINLDGLVVDLRNNGGGTLKSMQNISDMLLPEGVITYFEYKDGNKQYFRSSKEFIDIPLSVIINGSSASASEAFAGAIRDHSRGVLVGEKSFGKGIVQTVYPFSKTEKGNTAIYITTARYFTPKGECIHKKGINPDIEVALPDEYKYASLDELTMEQDTQLKTAWEKLLK
ncbi:MAG: S41 family peptidase [Monoglobales bacterium]